VGADQRVSKPLIAAVNGFALGAGCELALLCDVVIAGDNARFGLPEITLGIMPGAGGTQRLIRSVGKSLASKMVLTGESITRSRRRAPGWSAMFPGALTLEYALKQAALMARHSPLALQAAKQALRQSQEVPLQAGLARSASCLRCFLPPKTAGKASTPSYKNAPPTLKDANCGIYSQSCRTGRNDHYAEPSGASEQL
jgi:enoyl-CoA hydratase